MSEGLETVSKIALKDPAANAGELEVVEGAMHRNRPLVSDFEPTRLTDPTERPFHDPTDSTEAASVRHAGTGQMVLDAPLLQASAIARGAVRSVAVEVLRLSSWAPARTVKGRDVVQERHGLHRVVSLGSCYPQSQRCAPTVNDEVSFRTLLRSVRGVLSRVGPPKTARMLWLSIAAFDQSMRPSRPSRSRSSCSTFFHTPRRCQYRSRRQHVTPDPQPISWGSIHHGMPLCRTKTIPVRHARSSIGGRPRLPGPARCPGRSGRTTSHSSSGTNGPAIHQQWSRVSALATGRTGIFETVS